VQSGGNPVSWSPHPNPPALIFPPLCIQPYIGGQEPTSFYTIDPPPPAGQGLGLKNQLSPGDPFGDPLNGIPPSGLLTTLQNMYFEGPDRQSLPLAACLGHMMRQQVGHFVYMIDRARREIVVINSNRFQVLDRIPVSDPTNLAMSPNLDLLAVSNQKSNLVQFIDINPNSGTFHQVVKNTPVGSGPRGIAWDPANEDILVCNEPDNSVSIISAHTLAVRKTVKSQLNLPFDVVITQRQNGFGFQRNVYLAWILNRNGDLAVFESGPNGLNGWGYDDVIGVAPMNFPNPKAIAVDFNHLGGGAWVVHENQLGTNGLPTGQTGGAITNVIVAATTFGQLTLTGGNFFVNPQFRDMSIQVSASIGSDQLTGIPVDIAQDDQVNFGSLPNFQGLLQQNYSAGVPAAINGKSYVRQVNGIATGAKHPRFLFAAIPNSIEGPGVVDVFNLQSSNLRFDTDPYLPGKQSIPVPGVNLLIDYWRQ
ncbi:MAG: beta-propeller fold lactonase family protein, partial [Acidimicrobiia bacterium]|nr:beta-propeller fold lactonase family protein [Acidimicrobiia bacterium]